MRELYPVQGGATERGRRYFDPTINDFREAKYFNPNGPDYDEVIINDTHIPILDPYQN